jgi:hypothetical protein
MKTYITYNKITGEIIQLNVASDISAIQHLVTDTTDILEIPSEINTGMFYVDVVSKNLVAIPDQPSVYHKFDYLTKTWQDVRTEAQKLQQASWEVLNQRKQLLDSTDWRIIKAMDTGTPIAPAWQTYRQQLRDITQQTGYPFTVTWPQPPSQ